MQCPRLQGQTSSGDFPVREAGVSRGALSALVAVLVTTLFVGCTDSVPTAVDGHATSEAASVAALSKVKPTTTGVITRATFEDAEVCGIPVSTELFRAGAQWENPLPGHPPLKGTGTVRVTWTAANGKSIQLHASGQAIREITEWIDDRTFRATETVIGAPQTLKTPHGPPLVMDVGRIVFGFLIQLSETGGFIILEREILEMSGPHPQAEDPALFCQIVTEVLT